ncbi:uncharacterized protein MEPE_06543 [Melanopsichium pennsylvanicum]|uniref:Uncharacterized protein n=1 Tax=Melanopsichium pennsylvanicum TaxID=63383 RepID=A0AAJ4XSW9_9BASI|nr:uncharacterized protein MEPE_06543 [Melanopsichium pennsylvanicum]
MKELLRVSNKEADFCEERARLAENGKGTPRNEIIARRWGRSAEIEKGEGAVQARVSEKCAGDGREGKKASQIFFYGWKERRKGDLVESYALRKEDVEFDTTVGDYIETERRKQMQRMIRSVENERLSSL